MAVSKAGRLAAVLAGSVLLSGCGSDKTSSYDDDDGQPSKIEVPASPKSMSCAYPPADTFGAFIGDTIPGTLSWTGYAANSAEITEVPITDFFDCDGTKGIDAVMFETVGFG